MKVMEIAIEFGRTVVIRQKNTKINIELQSLLKKKIFKSGNERTIVFAK